MQFDIPTPFSRPSIDLSKSKRVWRELEPGAVRAGDIISGLGLVKSILINRLDENAYSVCIRAGEDNESTYLVHQGVWDRLVYAFVEEGR